MCLVGLWTSQVSASDPAYIFARAANMPSIYTCEATIETSTDGGQTWTSGTPITLPADPPPTPPIDPASLVLNYANTDAVYDGPGHLGRACAKAPDSTLACTAAISLGPSAGTPPDPALPVARQVGSNGAGNSSVACWAVLKSTTSAKEPDSLVDAEFTAGDPYNITSGIATSRCEGWLETSADHGATWQASSPPVTFQAPAGSGTYAFIGTAPDGPGFLARACVEAPTVSKTPSCSWTW
jgi:hypothetical protein